MNLPKFLTSVAKLKKNGHCPGDCVFVAERREHPRRTLEVPIDCSDMDGKKQWGVAADASEGGLLVYLNEALEKGSLVRIQLFSRKGSELNTIKAMARVVWSESAAQKVPGDYRHGLAFQAFYKESLDKLRVLLREATETQST